MHALKTIKFLTFLMNGWYIFCRAFSIDVRIVSIFWKWKKKKKILFEIFELVKMVKFFMSSDNDNDLPTTDRIWEKNKKYLNSNRK